MSAGKLITTALLLSCAVACTDDGVSSGPANPMMPIIGTAAPYGYASGRVTESGSNLPIASATVVWADLGGVWEDAGDGVSTDANGSYQLTVGPLHGPGNAERRFLLRASKIGYLSQEVEVQLPAAGSDLPRTPTVNFDLKLAM